MSVDTIAERALRGIAAAHAMGPAPLRPGAALPPFALRSVWTDAVVTQEDIARLGHPAVLIVCPPSRLSAAASREHAPESPELNRSGAECGSVEGHDATGFFDPSRASELTSIADAAADRGVTVVAVVSRPPATPAEELVARRLGFHALVDPTLAFARALGVVCDVSPAATALCSQWGADMSAFFFRATPSPSSSPPPSSPGVLSVEEKDALDPAPPLARPIVWPEAPGDTLRVPTAVEAVVGVKEDQPSGPAVLNDHVNIGDAPEVCDLPQGIETEAWGRGTGDAAAAPTPGNDDIDGDSVGTSPLSVATPPARRTPVDSAVESCAENAAAVAARASPSMVIAETTSPPPDTDSTVSFASNASSKAALVPPFRPFGAANAAPQSPLMDDELVGRSGDVPPPFSQESEWPGNMLEVTLPPNEATAELAPVGSDTAFGSSSTAVPTRVVARGITPLAGPLPSRPTDTTLAANSGQEMRPTHSIDHSHNTATTPPPPFSKEALMWPSDSVPDAAAHPAPPPLAWESSAPATPPPPPLAWELSGQPAPPPGSPPFGAPQSPRVVSGFQRAHHASVTAPQLFDPAVLHGQHGVRLAPPLGARPPLLRSRTTADLPPLGPAGLHAPHRACGPLGSLAGNLLPADFHIPTVPPRSAVGGTTQAPHREQWSPSAPRAQHVTRPQPRPRQQRPGEAWSCTQHAAPSSPFAIFDRGAATSAATSSGDVRPRSLPRRRPESPAARSVETPSAFAPPSPSRYRPFRTAPTDAVFVTPTRDEAWLPQQSTNATTHATVEPGPGFANTRNAAVALHAPPNIMDVETGVGPLCPSPPKEAATPSREASVRSVMSHLPAPPSAPPTPARAESPTAATTAVPELVGLAGHGSIAQPPSPFPRSPAHRPLVGPPPNLRSEHRGSSSSRSKSRSSQSQLQGSQLQGSQLQESVFSPPSRSVRTPVMSQPDSSDSGGGLVAGVGDRVSPVAVAPPAPVWGAAPCLERSTRGSKSPAARAASGGGAGPPPPSQAARAAQSAQPVEIQHLPAPSQPGGHPSPSPPTTAKPDWSRSAVPDLGRGPPCHRSVSPAATSGVHSRRNSGSRSGASSTAAIAASVSVARSSAPVASGGLPTSSPQHHEGRPLVDVRASRTGEERPSTSECEQPGTGSKSKGTGPDWKSMAVPDLNRAPRSRAASPAVSSCVHSRRPSDPGSHVVLPVAPVVPPGPQPGPPPPPIAPLTNPRSRCVEGGMSTAKALCSLSSLTSVPHTACSWDGAVSESSWASASHPPPTAAVHSHHKSERGSKNSSPTPKAPAAEPSAVPVSGRSKPDWGNTAVPDLGRATSPTPTPRGSQPPAAVPSQAGTPATRSPRNAPLECAAETPPRETTSVAVTPLRSSSTKVSPTKLAPAAKTEEVTAGVPTAPTGEVGGAGAALTATAHLHSASERSPIAALVSVLDPLLGDSSKSLRPPGDSTALRVPTPFLASFTTSSGRSAPQRSSVPSQSSSIPFTSLAAESASKSSMPTCSFDNSQNTGAVGGRLFQSATSRASTNKANSLSVGAASSFGPGASRSTLSTSLGAGVGCCFVLPSVFLFGVEPSAGVGEEQRCGMSLLSASVDDDFRRCMGPAEVLGAVRGLEVASLGHVHVE